jgi:hypothetical protein
MRLRLAPLPFFIGLGVGFAVLTWLGGTVESTRLARNFVRFHQNINVESGYFPTARQIRSIIDYPNDRAPQVFVVVGGTSVFHGVGQHESLLWTRLLQKQLGPEFGVFNFAQRAGSMGDFGNIAADRWRREHLQCRDSAAGVILSSHHVRCLEPRLSFAMGSARRDPVRQCLARPRVTARSGAGRTAQLLSQLQRPLELCRL